MSPTADPGPSGLLGFFQSAEPEQRLRSVEIPRGVIRLQPDRLTERLGGLSE